MKYSVGTDKDTKKARLVDWKLNFDDHISYVCKKASGKLNASARIAAFIELCKRCILMNAFFDFQFTYWPLIWMCHNRINDRKINRFHERCLVITYNNKQSSFLELLEKDASVYIHRRNIQLLAIEMFCVGRNTAALMMKIFCYKIYINSIGFVWEQKRNLEYSVSLGELFLSLASTVFCY